MPHTEQTLDLTTVIYEKRDHIAWVTLNRPERGNALNEQLCLDLERVWLDYARDEDSWIAVLTGAGRMFCTGADVKDIADSFARGTRLKRFTVGGRNLSTVRITAKSIGCYKPVITAVNGVCTGGGLHLAADADIVIASETATFFDSHVAAGHVSGLDVVLLTRRIPAPVAIRMAIVGNEERMSAQRAYEVGFVTEVVPPERLLDEAAQTAAKILRNSPTAVRRTIEAAWKGMEVGLTPALEHGFWLIQEQWATEDFEEGNRAFAERRRPAWKGR